MIDIGLVYFRAVDLRYLDAAWYSLSRQDFTKVRSVIVLDNDTHDDPKAIQEVLQRYPVPVPVHLIPDKHGEEAKRCHSWSVNQVMRMAEGPWVLFTRADYILDFDTVQLFSRSTSLGEFVTSYAYHMAFDERGDQRVEGFRDIEQHGWREHGTGVLLEKVNGWKVDSSHTDAGVWVIKKDRWAEVGGLNENLRAWGLQQTVFQQALKEAGVQIVQIPQFLFFHQHHGGSFRSYDVAVAELEAHWGPREKLGTFRDISRFIGSVCDELDH